MQYASNVLKCCCMQRMDLYCDKVKFAMFPNLLLSQFETCLYELFTPDKGGGGKVFTNFTQSYMRQFTEQCTFQSQKLPN